MFALPLLAVAMLFGAPPDKPAPKITMDAAKTIALKKEAGTIKSSELEKEKGRWIYSFDVQTPTSLHEVNVDANTGDVVEDSVESKAAEKKEAAADAKAAKAAKTAKPQ